MHCTWRDRRLLILLATGSLIVMTGAIIAPILPQMTAQLGLDPAIAGYLVSAHYLTVAIFSPLFGLLADRTGAARVLIISLLLYAVFGSAGGLLNDFAPILVTRALVGAASGGIAAASLGMLVQRYETESARSQAIAYVATVLTLANIVYPILAGLIGSWHWRWVFALYGLAVPLALLVRVNWGWMGNRAEGIGQRLRREPSKPAEREQKVHSGMLRSAQRGQDAGKLMRVIGNWRMLQLYTAQCLCAAIAHATIIYLPLYLEATFGTGTVLIGAVLACQGLGAAAIAAFGVRQLGQRLGLDKAASVGLGIMAVTLVAVPQIPLLLLLFPTAILFGMGLGIVVPSLYNLMSNLAPANLQATVLAIGVGTGFLGQFIAPSLFGFVVGLQGLAAVFYGAAVLALMLGLGSAAMRR